MERKVACDIALGCLFERSRNGYFYLDVFKEYLGRGFRGNSTYNIPVSPLMLHSVCEKNDNVFISENVYDGLTKIQDLTAETGQEIPFFMIGYEKENGSILFNSLIYDKSQSSSLECDFSGLAPIIAQYLADLNYNDIRKNGKPVICEGHTHGNITDVSDNFSFGDLGGYVSLKDNIRNCMRKFNRHGINPNSVDTVGMLLAPCGDFNMVYYYDDEEHRGFYKFNNLFVVGENGDIIPLPTMSDDGNYIRRSNSIFKRR